MIPMGTYLISSSLISPTTGHFVSKMLPLLFNSVQMYSAICGQIGDINNACRWMNSKTRSTCIPAAPHNSRYVSRAACNSKKHDLNINDLIMKKMSIGTIVVRVIPLPQCIFEHHFLVIFSSLFCFQIHFTDEDLISESIFWSST